MHNYEISKEDAIASYEKQFVINANCMKQAEDWSFKRKEQLRAILEASTAFRHSAII